MLLSQANSSVKHEADRAVKRQRLPMWPVNSTSDDNSVMDPFWQRIALIAASR